MTTARKWLVGCGIGCAVALLLAMGACLVGALFVRHTFRGIETANESHVALVDALGEVDDYAPPAGGVPEADRLELFAGVREVTSDERRAIDAVLAQLPPDELHEGSVSGRIGASMRMVGNLIDVMGTYIAARNQALLKRGMGVGEYVFLYTLVYHSWLGHAPGIGPPSFAGEDAAQVDVIEDDDPLFGEEAVRRRYRRYVLGLLERQIASAESAGADEAWIALLRGESHRMEVDPGRVLWADGLPPPVEAALQPFRVRLEATWSPASNRLELPLAEHETPWEWR